MIMPLKRKGFAFWDKDGNAYCLHCYEQNEHQVSIVQVSERAPDAKCPQCKGTFPGVFPSKPFKASITWLGRK